MSTRKAKSVQVGPTVLTEGVRYLCTDSGRSYLRAGETYTAERIGKRDVYLRHMSGCGTTVALWMLGPDARFAAVTLVAEAASEKEAAELAKWNAVCAEVREFRAAVLDAFGLDDDGSD